MDRQPSSHSCFLCGRHNDRGLKMVWYNDYDTNTVWSKVVVPAEFNGYPGFVHGGIVAALLDETSGRALLLDGDFDRLFVTGKLEINYRRPTPTGQELTVVGWVTRKGSQRARVAGEIRLADGTVTADCRALVIRRTDKYLDSWNWEQERDYWKVDPDGED